jgi:tRNA (mo5U34)-methyltransferase
VEAAELARLRNEVIRLGPWALDVEITPELRTRVALDVPPGTYSDSFGEVGFYDPTMWFKKFMTMIYPEGLSGRRVLDCGCNCGAFLFLAKELGAGECVGFDVREHWIRQARFLAANRAGPGTDIRFEVCELSDLPGLALEPFDVVLFHGIFYHLPDPIHGLRIAADLSKELISVSTAAKGGLPDGTLFLSDESRTALMSGVHGLNWFPTGPKVMTTILESMGFPGVRCTGWVPYPDYSDLERLHLIASRSPDLIEKFEANRGWSNIMDVTIPPRGSVVVMAPRPAQKRRDRGNEPRPPTIQGRRRLGFPSSESWRFAPDDPTDDHDAIRQLEELAEEADFLLVRGGEEWWFDRYPGLYSHIQDKYPLVVDAKDKCMIFKLRSDA